MKKEIVSTAHSGNRANSPTRLPTVIAIGPPRTGTTWLDAVLRGHVCLPSDVKETQFFKWNYEKGLDWYAWHFRNCSADLPIMEICPSYFDFAPARERIKSHMPNCKIICILRDPVERLYSVYRHYSGFAGFKSFDELIEDASGLFDASDYVTHLRGWHRDFGKENTLVAFYEDLESSPQQFLDSICDFVGITRFDLKETEAGTKRINASSRKPRSRRLGMVAGNLRGWLLAHRAHKLVNAWQKTPLWDFCFAGGEEFGPPSPELERRLREHFRPSVKALEELLGRDLSAWR